MTIDPDALEFEWDRGNRDKNKKHRVNDLESEEVFFDEDKRILRDKLHSGNEERLILIGRTKRARLLYVVFTKRGKRIRIISARDINKKEAYLYEKTS